MSNPSKRKGSNYERELVNQARARGLNAERAYASNGRALGECEECDLLLAGLRVQAKRRKKIPVCIADVLSVDVDVYATREDGGETVVLMTYDTLLKLLETNHDKP